MKAITVQQPWAWAIVHGGKSVENRTRIGTWRPALGERIAIHAGQRWSDRGEQSPLIQQAWCEHVGGGPCWCFNRDDADFVYGAIIGTVIVDDVHPAYPETHAFGNTYAAACCDNPWGEQSYVEHGGIVHLTLSDPQPCDPIPCRGALGLWTVSTDIVVQLTADAAGRVDTFNPEHLIGERA
jgi:hypothetical protein